MKTLEEFERMVRVHDLTYMYSDDGSVYRRGSESYAKILAEALNHPRADVVRIWNQVALEKLLSGYAESFLWKE
jgi:hypothetical protein